MNFANDTHPAPEVFDSLEEAVAYCDAQPRATAVVSNSPRPGLFSVSLKREEVYGDYRDLMLSLLRQEDRAEARDRAEYESELARCALHKIGAELASERGLTDAAAEMFRLGFAGECAKVANPRAQGLEPIFREGRKAKNCADVSRRVRVAVHGIRSNSTFKDFAESKHGYHPVPYFVE